MSTISPQKLQAEHDALEQALARLEAQKTELQNAQSRLWLMQEIKRLGVAHDEYIGFQPETSQATA